MMSITIGTPEVVAGVLILVLNAYVLTGGADFGGGVWDLFARGERAEQQRTLIADSLAPIWEANHVWLIVAVVVLFTAFPAAFGVVGTALHIPLSLMLVGIVLRGSAFVLRAYGNSSAATKHRWGVLFATASALTPLLLGVVIGTIASGDVKLDARGTFASVFVRPWLAPFPLSVGVFALFLFAFLAAVYLALRAGDEALREDFRKRALLSAGGVFLAALLTLIIAVTEAPDMPRALLRSAWALPFQIAVAAVSVTAILALLRRRYRVARIAAAAQVSLVLWGWAFAQFPFVLPGQLTIGQAAAPPITLRLVLIGLAGGAIVLLPSLRYLFRVFPPRDP